MLTRDFWRGAFERALKTFIQTGVAALIAAVGAATTAWDVDWLTGAYSALGVGLLAAFLSLATSLGNANFVAGRPTDDGGLPLRSKTTVTEYAADGDIYGG